MSWKETAKLWESFEALEEGLKVQLQSMDDTQKEEAFYTPLEFGTAGMRGIVGPGINRMNTYTVRQATEGLSRLIESYGEEAKKTWGSDCLRFTSFFTRIRNGVCTYFSNSRD